MARDIFSALFNIGAKVLTQELQRAVRESMQNPVYPAGYPMYNNPSPRMPVVDNRRLIEGKYEAVADIRRVKTGKRKGKKRVRVGEIVQIKREKDIAPELEVIDAEWEEI